MPPISLHVCVRAACVRLCRGRPPLSALSENISVTSDITRLHPSISNIPCHLKSTLWICVYAGKYFLLYHGFEYPLTALSNGFE